MRRWLAGLAAFACTVTACSSTINGNGHPPTGNGPTGPGFSGPQTPGPTGSAPAPTGGPTGTVPPGGSTNGPAPVTSCPHVSYPYAHLTFDCIAAGLVAGTTPDPVWPLNLQKSVESSWAMSEGAGHWGATGGQSLEAIAKNLRSQMLTEQAYGTSPQVKTTSSKAAKVAGVSAWVLQTSFTINPQFRKQRGLKVKVEKSWIVALKVGSDDVSLWYVTLPDDVSALWGKVPAIMQTIKVS